MSKNGIVAKEFEDRISAAGLTVSSQSGFNKVQGSKGRLYVARTKTVYRVDVSDCSPPEHAAITQVSEQEAKDLRLGKVRAQLDFTKEPAQVLEAFELLLQHIA